MAKKILLNGHVYSPYFQKNFLSSRVHLAVRYFNHNRLEQLQYYFDRFFRLNRMSKKHFEALPPLKQSINEVNALKVFAKSSQLDIRSGFNFINPYQFLVGGEVDGCILDDNSIAAIIEVKTFQALYKTSVEEFLQSIDKVGFYHHDLMKVGDEWALRPSSKYYSQIQCNLMTLNLSFTVLLIYSPFDMSIYPIYILRNEEYIYNLFIKLETMMNYYVINHLKSLTY